MSRPIPPSLNAIAHNEQPSAKPVVLFVDDDAGNRQGFQAAFRHQMTVLLAANLHEAWVHLSTQQVHVLIADQRMPTTTGSELLTLVKERYPQVRRMLVTAYSDLEAIIDAVNHGGVSKYFAKPWIADQLTKAVLEAHADYLRDQEREAYTKSLEEANRQLEFALRQRLLS